MPIIAAGREYGATEGRMVGGMIESREATLKAIRAALVGTCAFSGKTADEIAEILHPTTPAAIGRQKG